jgi:hypothetical protein
MQAAVMADADKAAAADAADKAAEADAAEANWLTVRPV